MASDVSVIVCSRNRSRLLGRMLEALTRQSLQKDTFEVIVIDDASDDDTAGVCERMKEKLRNLRYFRNSDKAGVSRSRSRGVEKAQGEYLLFTDDDCIPAEDWIEHMCDALARGPVVAGAVVSPEKNYIKLCHNVAQFHAVMAGRRQGPAESIAGANMGYRASVFKDIGMFDYDVCLAEDMEFLLRARTKGYSAIFAGDACVVHDHERTSIPDIIQYAADHASQTILLRQRYSEMLNTPLVLRSSVLLIVAAPLIALWVTAGIYARNAALRRLLHTAPVVYILKLAWCWGAAKTLWQKSRDGKGHGA